MLAVVPASWSRSHACAQLVTCCRIFLAPSCWAPGRDLGRPHGAGFGRLFLGQEAGWALGSKVGWGEMWVIRGLILKWTYYPLRWVSPALKLCSTWARLCPGTGHCVKELAQLPMGHRHSTKDSQEPLSSRRLQFCALYCHTCLSLTFCRPVFSWAASVGCLYIS